MMIDQSPQELRDFVLYSFKAYQDVLLSALEKYDHETTQVVLKELTGSLSDYQSRDRDFNLEMLEFQLGREMPQEERSAVQKRHDQVRERKSIVDAISLGRNQVLFGLASRALELFVTSPNERNKILPLVLALFAYLPQPLKDLTAVFDSISEGKAEDFWGWRWWDFRPDGQVHQIDSHSRPNRLYVVRALERLSQLSDEQIQRIQLECTDRLDYPFSDNNPQGVPAMIREVVEHPDNYTGLLTAQQLAKADTLLRILTEARARLEEERQQRLATAPVDPAKLLQFKDAVLRAYQRTARLRPLIKKLGSYRDRTNEKPDAAVKSWGYNQLDDKAAFVADWHVSYSGWGEAYGRGLGQAEDHSAFEEMVKAVEHAVVIEKGDLIPQIAAQIRKHQISNPIVIQSLRTTLEFEEIRRRELFIARHRDDCPRTAIDKLDGFLGVLKFNDMSVPVFDVFMQDRTLRDNVIVADLSQFVAWAQYDPSDDLAEKNDVIEGVLVRVIDLSADAEQRDKLVQANPDWLQKQPVEKRDMYVRTRVIVNVYERYELEFPKKAAAVKLTIQTSGSTD